MTPETKAFVEQCEARAIPERIIGFVVGHSNGASEIANETKRLCAVTREQDAEIGQLRVALKVALDEWEYASTYKGDFLAEKHGDALNIADLRKLLPA